MSRMSEEKMRTVRDVARAEIISKVVQDAIWRFNDEAEEAVTVYDVVGAVVQDLMAEGLCPACMRGAIDDAFVRAEVDAETHVADDDAGTPTRNEDGVYH